MAAQPNTPEALLMVIADAMPGRVMPRCRHFGVCGGCQLQDFSQAQQLSAKATMLREVLHRAGIQQIPVIETHAASAWEYRNRARFRVEGGALGYSRRASNEFLAIQECPIISPLLWRTAGLLQELTRDGKTAWPQGADAVEVFTNEDGSGLQLSLQLNTTVASVDREAPRAFRRLCEALRADLPQLSGAGMSVNATPDRAVRRRLQESQQVEIARWGETYLTYTVDGRAYRITRNAFFQVNRFLTAAMVREVVAAGEGGIAWDLFAGAGLFSVPLTGRFQQVLAVEIAEPAATDLAAHLRACGPEHRAIRSTVQDFSTRQARTRLKTPDLIVLDPPRAGLNVATANGLLQAGAGTVVYVSCNAATFARDARPLIQSGYTLASLHFFDLFPQTFHTETIAVFRR